MRVDNVSLRIYDTRYFHRFGSDKVLIETKTSDASFEQLGAQGHSTSVRVAGVSLVPEHLALRLDSVCSHCSVLCCTYTGPRLSRTSQV